MNREAEAKSWFFSVEELKIMEKAMAHYLQRPDHLAGTEELLVDLRMCIQERL